MPIYEYVCTKCGDHHEVIQKMSDKPLTRCAKCKGRLEKAVSKSSFAFKGSGWYVTDYAKSGSSSTDSASKSESPSKSDSSSTSETRSKSEGASKTEIPAVKTDSSSPVSTTPSKTKSD